MSCINPSAPLADTAQGRNADSCPIMAWSNLGSRLCCLAASSISGLTTLSSRGSQSGGSAVSGGGFPSSGISHSPRSSACLRMAARCTATAARCNSAAVGGGFVLTAAGDKLPAAGGFPAPGALDTAGAFDVAARVCASRLFGTPLTNMRRAETIQPRNAGRCANIQRRIRTPGFDDCLIPDCLILYSYRPKPRLRIGVPGKARCDPHAHTETRVGDSVTC